MGYWFLLGRLPDSPELVRHLSSALADETHLRSVLFRQNEFRTHYEKTLAEQMAREEMKIQQDLFELHRNHCYLSPRDLRVGATPLERVLIVGSCFSHSWRYQEWNHDNLQVDYVMHNGIAELPEYPPCEEVEKYGLMIVQIPLRFVLEDTKLCRIDPRNTRALEKFLGECCSRLRANLDSAMQWNRKFGILSFVANFMAPQANALGRLTPRYSLANPVHFMERLNMHLCKCMEQYKNTYLLDLDQISSVYGRRLFQEDGLFWTSHGSLWPGYPANTSRMEPIPSIQEHYLTDNDLFRKALWETAISMYRTIHRVDTVKLVVLDLDDTLWEGLAGEQEEVGPHMFENWFLGIAEALHYLRKRGILLAIVSKNDEQWVRSLWKKIVVGRLWLDEFAVVKINWNPKPDNMREILEQLNLLPRNVLFIDDNPAEREAMQTAFPEMRVLGRYTYYLRRILLWSAETQVAEITEESGNRTNIVRSQIERDKLRPKMSRQEFLAALKLRIKMNEIQDTGHPRFARALELLNKTNQFNSNGRRWKHEECAALFAADGRFLIFSARDRFSDYGTVGVVVIRADVIEQFVMSCRVVGLELEIGAVLLALEKLRQFGIFEVTASIEETSANFVCRDLYQRCGFTASGSHWVSATSGTKPWPGHLETEP